MAPGDAHPAPWLGRLLIVSLLVMLNLPLLTTWATGMDQYGFFTLVARPWPVVLSLVLSAFSAGVAYLAYGLLRKRAWFPNNRYGAYQRDAVIFGVPVAIAFLPSFLLTGGDDRPLVLGVAGIMATSLCLTAALNDGKTRLDAGVARILLIVCAAIILTLIALSISGILAMYFVEHSPSGSNLFWSWEFARGDLGYPAEEFNQRHRNGLLAFGIAGIWYMAVVLGGSLLGAVLGLAQDGEEWETTPGTQPAKPLTDRTVGDQTLPEGPRGYLLYLNNEPETISERRYRDLLANRDNHLPADTELLVDKVSETALAKIEGKWEEIAFRGRRKGPFLLLCIYAREPGARFTTKCLRSRLKQDMPDREDFNVSDFFSQLKKKPALQELVRRDGNKTYICGATRVCFLDQNSAPLSNYERPRSLLGGYPGGPQELLPRGSSQLNP